MKKNEKKGNKKSSAVIVLLLLLCISIGYAALSATLKINGTTHIKGATWNVSFIADTVEVTDGSVTLPSDSEKNVTKDGKVVPVVTANQVTYEVELGKPGDFYEFTVKVKNSGSLDAQLEKAPELVGIPEEYEGIITYTVTDTGHNQTGDVLASGDSYDVTVKVKYEEDITNSQLITEDGVNFPLTYTMSYVQA